MCEFIRPGIELPGYVAWSQIAALTAKSQNQFHQKGRGVWFLGREVQ